MMRLLVTLLVSTVALGPGAGAASADDIVWGVNDDAGKYEQGAKLFEKITLGEYVEFLTLPAYELID